MRVPSPSLALLDNVRNASTQTHCCQVPNSSSRYLLRYHHLLVAQTIVCWQFIRWMWHTAFYKNESHVMFYEDLQASVQRCVREIDCLTTRRCLVLPQSLYPQKKISNGPNLSHIETQAQKATGSPLQGRLRSVPCVGRPTFGLKF